MYIWRRCSYKTFSFFVTDAPEKYASGIEIVKYTHTHTERERERESEREREQPCIAKALHALDHFTQV